MTLDNTPKAEILIVDDTPQNVLLLAAMLRSNQYTIREAADGPSALEAVRQSPPDLILLDIRMPGMDGYEVCRRLKSDENLREPPVIFVSALDDQTDIIQGFAAGGVDYITKPFKMKEVLARLETHLTITRLQRQLSEQNHQLQQEIAERQRAEQALQQANEALEQRVAERTAELVRANIELNNELQERRRVEKEREELLLQVRNQAHQVREIINTVPDGVLVLDVNGLVTLANTEALACLGILAPAWSAQSITQSYSPAMLLQHGRPTLTLPLTHMGDRSLTDLLRSPSQGNWHEVKASGQTYEITARILPFETGNHNWVMVIRDVTEERNTKRLIQQQDRLAAVGQMASGIAHDFNNILAVILLYTEMALSSSQLSPRLQERLITISQQAQHGSNLIQQILDFSRRSVLERQPMDLLPFLKEQAKLLRRTLAENIHIELDCQEGTYTIEADPTRIQQIMMNLTVNARDAMPDGGVLTFRLRHLPSGERIQCCTCGTVEGGHWIALEVQDSGTGISPDVIPHIFEPFFTTKELGKGTGLGLPQVYGIAKSHDGHIDISTEAGKGSKFTVYLPVISSGSQLLPDTGPLDLRRGQGERILLIEDEKMTRQALVDTLTLINYRVVALTNGQEALNYLDNHLSEVDLILSDVIMPEVGGIALLKTLRQKGIQLPVILMTGHALNPEAENLQSYGLSGWLLKPPRVRRLAQMIANALLMNSSIIP